MNLNSKAMWEKIDTLLGSNKKSGKGEVGRAASPSFEFMVERLNRIGRCWQCRLVLAPRYHENHIDYHGCHRSVRRTVNVKIEFVCPNLYMFCIVGQTLVTEGTLTRFSERCLDTPGVVTARILSCSFSTFEMWKTFMKFWSNLSEWIEGINASFGAFSVIGTK